MYFGSVAMIVTPSKPVAVRSAMLWKSICKACLRLSRLSIDSAIKTDIGSGSTAKGEFYCVIQMEKRFAVAHRGTRASIGRQQPHEDVRLHIVCGLPECREEISERSKVIVNQRLPGKSESAGIRCECIRLAPFDDWPGVYFATLRNYD